jgi:hypothetical protein
METDGGSRLESSDNTIGYTRQKVGKEWFNEECGKVTNISSPIEREELVYKSSQGNLKRDWEA